MKKKVLHIPILLLFGAVSLQAQVDSSQILTEVTVVDFRLEALQIAQFQYKKDSLQRLISTAESMAEWLQNVSSVHVRQYAPGSAASFSTRGATSAQSAILWSGFSLNSAATGVSDLSLLPTELFEPTVLLGGSASYFGSGAIGGVLNLAENKKKQLGWHGNFSQQVASFNTYKTALAASYLNNKFYSKTALLFEESKNDFEYVNTYKIPSTEEIRQHAGYQQFHINQRFEIRLKKKQKVESEIWYNNATRETPNSILINKPAAALLKDNYLRSRIVWQNEFEKNKINLAYAFLYEWQTFEDSTVKDFQGKKLQDTNITASHVFQANHEMFVNRNLKWQNGLQLRFDGVSGSNRTGQQNTLSAQSGMFYNKKRIAAQAVIRAEFWNDKLLPVSPFASLRAELLKNFFASIYGGYNYRIPSLNDRFWLPGGNLNLQPESGWTGEGALFYQVNAAKKTALIRVSGYRNALNNYIQWVPGPNGIWSPQNVKVVSLSGIDFNANFSHSIRKWYFSGQANASVNQAEVKESTVKGDESEGKQLIYQPKYKSTMGVTLGYSGVNAHANYRYTSAVATSYDGSTQDLAAFNIIDVSLSKSFLIKKMNFTVIAAINNISNQSFQTIPFYPMPGRNFSFTLKIAL